MTVLTSTSHDMTAVSVEICIEALDPVASKLAATAASVGGADRIELCANMSQDGLTPSVEVISAVRAAFGGELLVMIRPRAGNFHYSHAEEQTMAAEIRAAAKAGADGVVLGALEDDNRLSVGIVQRLLSIARQHEMTTTFHRAFDATPNADAALGTLIDLGVTRVLTSGCPWGSHGTVFDGVERLCRTIRHAASRVEVVLGGGVTAPALPKILRALPLGQGPVSIHAYSGAQTDGITTPEAVRALVDAARNARK